MIRRLTLCIVLACPLAAPTAALARDGGRERFPDPRIEATDVAPTDETTTTTEQPTVPVNKPETASEPAADTDTTSGDGKDSGEGGRRGARGDLPGVPELSPAFLRRVWRFAVEADGYDADAHVLSATIDRVVGGGPRRARRVLADVDAAVLVTSTTRVIDADGQRVGADGVAAALDGADTALVTGKLLARAKWQRDEDGDAVATLRAKRIRLRD
ncbi:MAG TPA: hypothetical protein VGJ70_21985 [Solirubrobacteraceae bacterium]